MSDRKFEERRNRHIESEIRKGMARAFFVTEWANEQEEKGRSFSGQDIMDVAPPTGTDAKSAAIEFADRLKSANGGSSLYTIYARAKIAGGSGDPRTFGHYMAMQGMGHGVSWFDNNPEFTMRGRPFIVPRYEYYRGAGRSASHRIAKKR